MLISEAFNAYRQDYVVFANQSVRTEEHLMQTLVLFLKFYSDMNIEDITFELVRDWKIALTKTRSCNTVRGYIIKLRLVLRYCKLEGINVLDPETIPIPQRQKTTPKYLEAHEVTELIESIKQCPEYTHENKLRDMLIISMIYASGLRVSELVAINQEDLHEGRFTVVGKGGKPRLCFYDDRTQDLIIAYLRHRTDKCPALFYSSQTRGRISVATVQFVVKLVSCRVGKSITPHTLRHSFATNLMQNGMHIYEMSRLLGHASIETTQMYLHTTDINLENAYKNTHSIT